MSGLTKARILAVLWAIGAYAIIFGVLIVVFAFRIRSFVSEVTRA
jgi:uncharacterized membrane protein HdeD (DUF308 family)